MPNQFLESFRGKSICILGYGREGMSTHRFLHKVVEDVDISLADERSDHRPLFPVNHYYSGPDYLKSTTRFDIVIKSPGIPLAKLPEYKRSTKLSSQTEIFLKSFPGTVIGITGTYGKSTTSSLVHNLLSSQRDDVHLLGNIGIPPLDVIESTSAGSLAVFEMSSHQLQHGEVSPDVAVFLNLHPEHLDYYGSFEAYQSAKQRIAAFPRCKMFIYNSGYSAARDWPSPEVRRVSFSGTDLDSDYSVVNGQAFYRGSLIGDLPSNKALQGSHNEANIAAALAACAALDFDPKPLISQLEHFKPLPHRMQFIGEFSSRRFYDDSASTAPEATLAAVRALSPLDTLIVGGMDRGIELHEFCRNLAQHQIGSIIGVPQTGHNIIEILKANDADFNLISAENLEAAVREALFRTPESGVCLFSPGAASYNAFSNFVQRGNAFRSYLTASSTAR